MRRAAGGSSTLPAAAPVSGSVKLMPGQRSQVGGQEVESASAQLARSLSWLLFYRKAITKSGLQHLAPPPPTPGAPCGESERQIRSTVDWSVSSWEGCTPKCHWVPAPAGLWAMGEGSLGLWSLGRPPGIATFEPGLKSRDNGKVRTGKVDCAGCSKFVLGWRGIGQGMG